MCEFALYWVNNIIHRSCEISNELLNQDSQKTQIPQVRGGINYAWKNYFRKLQKKFLLRLFIFKENLHIIYSSCYFRFPSQYSIDTNTQNTLLSTCLSKEVTGIRLDSQYHTFVRKHTAGI